MRLISLIMLAWSALTMQATAATVQSITRADYTYSDSELPPVGGWQSGQSPLMNLYAAPVTGRPPTVMWVRFHFDGSSDAGQPFAWTSRYMSERFRLFLNGREIYRNYADPREFPMSTFKPHFVGLPAANLQDGDNVIALRLESAKLYTLGVSRMEIGPEEAVRSLYDWRYITQFQGVLVSNSMLGVLALFALLLWLRRREDATLGWLALLGSLWFFRNLRYYLESPPLPIDLYWHIQINIIFAMMAVFYCFAARFLEIRNARLWMRVSLGIGGVAIVSQLVLTALNFSDVVSHLLVLPLTFAILLVFGRAAWINPRVENIAMFVASTIGVTSAIHDFGMGMNAWEGAEFALLPYAGVIIFLVFAFALGRRLVDALGTVENINVILAERVTAATDELARTQEQMRKLEVEVALEHERERIMREMHDSVGANLVAALAVAQNSNVSSATITTLKRSLADLRIAVDSLEQVEGDIPILLASFRHRMEPELRAAGWRFVWRVEDVPPLAWLTPPHALHLLRIMQEALTNALSHSGGNSLEIGCNAFQNDHHAGVQIAVSDNGAGLPKANIGQSRGRGLSNMQARARACNAQIDFEATATGGACVKLWLPLSLPTPE